MIYEINRRQQLRLFLLCSLSSQISDLRSRFVVVWVWVSTIYIHRNGNPADLTAGGRRVVVDIIKPNRNRSKKQKAESVARAPRGALRVRSQISNGSTFCTLSALGVWVPLCVFSSRFLSIYIPVSFCALCLVSCVSIVPPRRRGILIPLLCSVAAAAAAAAAEARAAEVGLLRRELLAPGRKALDHWRQHRYDLQHR